MEISLKSIIIIDIIFILQFIAFALPIYNKPISGFSTYNPKQFTFMLIQLFVIISLICQSVKSLFQVLTQDDHGKE